MSGAHGLHVALLGIDGIGKSTLASEFADAATRAGREVEITSWRRYLDPEGVTGADPARSALETLWVEAFRLYFAGASSDGAPVALPRSYDELERLGGIEYLAAEPVAGIRASGPLAAAWVELAANVLFQREVVRPLVDRGVVVIQDTFGYKHLKRAFGLASRLSPALEAEAEAAWAAVRAFFGGPLRPDVGIFVAGEPALALQWRREELRRTGVFETYAAAGDDPEESFLAVASESAADFEAFARTYGWIRVEVHDAPRAENRDRILGELRATPLTGVLGV